MGPILEALSSEFLQIDRRSRAMLSVIDETELYRRPVGSAGMIDPFSCGELIVRSAAEIEKTSGGITTRLWDDPYEWTLPEKLSSITSIIEYLDEVETTRLKSFQFITSDADLEREILAPAEFRSLGQLLFATMSRASHFQGRAYAVYQIVTERKPPRL